MAAQATAEQIREVNERYHDVAAGEYDSKWGIGFDAVGQDQVVTKVRKALGKRPPTFARALEIGSGTGYFTLNLMLAGIVESAVCTDISPGMLASLRANARRLGLEVETVAGDAAMLDLPAAGFDLVLGHAVLHHLPDLDAAFARFHELLAPGGRLVFAGEPSRYGDRLAAAPKRAAVAIAPLWRALLRARPAPVNDGTTDGDGEFDDHALEGFVDIHAFAPGDLRAYARRAGFDDVRVTGEELVASWFGWANRTLESRARPDDVPMLWRQYAYYGYRALQRLDRSVLEGRLPAGAFYNLLLSARRPL
ncbi:MAG TPA: class I SAM-dependent methyltransferase [Solirubrobacteraceae bacterium]|jgi:SAM-dependent methyltransferase